MRTADFAVFDDVLAPSQFLDVWDALKRREYAQPSSKIWQSVWRPADGQPLVSQVGFISTRPFSGPIDLAIDRTIEAFRLTPELVGAEGQAWIDAGFTLYAYPRGSRLSLHDDSNYAGTAVFWLHPKWGASWGGELMIPEVSKEESESLKLRNARGAESLLDRSDDMALLRHGRGHFILPKPNRLVVISAGVCHRMNRVDDDAGENLRCSLNAFLTRRTATGNEHAHIVIGT